MSKLTDQEKRSDIDKVKKLPLGSTGFLVESRPGIIKMKDQTGQGGLAEHRKEFGNNA
ncbi:hypothetical protein [Liquorilactobacillus mali]|uniref:hypothetical protein n=1 Tax=Liquorilactobacillus mali TaxID=1618 RepID=UPI0029532D68|nr:hypothetical protein [Liquorilactobacillus mali]